jgi:fructose-1,6-bisphosphatase-3
VRLGQDIKSTRNIIEHTHQRILVNDTDIGAELRSQIEDLKELLDAYRSGDLKERNLRPITNKR